ncbi:MAG TPA: rod shape-determining protein MreC [Candidatus Binatia bacterium]|nr:rod shape-determining protein MreC [Candidatus Binatia bacterium]
MTEIVAGRRFRRRAIAYSILLGSSLLLIAVSSTPPVREVQAGLAFALRPAQAALDEAARTVSGIVATIGEIDRLRRDNEALRQENERLRAEAARAEAIRRDNEQLTALLQLRSGLEWETVAARVIGRESSEFRRIVSLDRGADAGIEVGDVVIGAGGALVGRIIDVGSSFAHVLLINDLDSIVIGQFGSSGATGEVVGQLGGALVMRNIDATERISLGEEVVTAGIELAGGVRSPYPKGLLIGQVVDVARDPNAVVQTAYLVPPLDLDRLETVLVITSYEGGLPPADETPTDLLNPDGTLPEGEQPYVTPPPSASPGS